MANRLFDLNETKGTFQVRGIVSGVEKDSFFTEKKTTIIEDDVWIGQNVYITPGRHIKKGTIIGACCLLCKDFPEYSVVGGNPSKLIKSRLS